MTTHNLENKSTIDERILDKNDALDRKYYDNPETSRGARDLASSKQWEVSRLKWEIDKDDSIRDRVMKSPDGSRLYADMTIESDKLADIVNNPKNKDASGKMTKEALQQLEIQYNKIQKIMTELHGIVHGSVWSADKQLKDQINARVEWEKQKSIDFQDAMKEWRINQDQQESNRRKEMSAGFPPEWQYSWNPEKIKAANNELPGLSLV